jgi:large subunit ribosomal protein L16
LQAQEGAWITGNQIEAVRKCITNSLKREGRTWIRIFPDKPITKLPPEVTLGGGKGNLDHYVAVVKPGRILFEVDGVSEARAKAALKSGSYKLPIKTKVVVKAH